MICAVILAIVVTASVNFLCSQLHYYYHRPLRRPLVRSVPKGSLWDNSTELASPDYYRWSKYEHFMLLRVLRKKIRQNLKKYHLVRFLILSFNSLSAISLCADLS